MKTNKIMKNKNIKQLTNYLHKVVLGQLLADGHMEKIGIGKNCRLSFSFGTPHFNYGNWIHSLFNQYCSNTVYTIKSTTKGKIYENYRLKTKTLPIFNKYRDMFYMPVNNKYHKVVPDNIKQEICPIVLAYLIMGDGSFSHQDIRVRIYRNHFSYQECEMVANAITINCNIQCQGSDLTVYQNKEKNNIF